MTFMPGSIAFRFDPVIVQNPPALAGVLRALLRHVKFRSAAYRCSRQSLRWRTLRP